MIATIIVEPSASNGEQAFPGKINLLEMRAVSCGVKLIVMRLQ
jgi:hypothetical protein